MTDTGKSTDPKILIHASDPAPMLARLKKRHPSLQATGCSTYQNLPDKLQSFAPEIYYGIRFAGSAGFPRGALLGEFAPKWISVGGSGVDHLQDWDPKQIQVTNSAGVAASMMAEFILGGFLHFSLDIAGLQRDRGTATWQGGRQMVPLSGKTLLIVGLGQTGGAIAERAKAFGMHTIGTRARPRPTPHIDEVFSADQLRELWPRADFIAVCVPLLASTRGLIDAAAFNQMRDGVVLADVSRGGVIESAALVASLESGKLGGAVLDVFETEPLPSAHKLWQTPNTLVSPHCSSVFEGWEMASFDMFCDNVERYLADEPLRNLVDPKLGY
ncbi:MAG: D-2-hydroxyacid dehydrogenase [Rhizobiaceae bacterium]